MENVLKNHGKKSCQAVATPPCIRERHTFNLPMKKVFVLGLYKMLMKQKHCDLEIETSDGIIKVHKVVLCASSTVFWAMFDHETPENKTSLIRIPEVTSNTMHLTLEYMYTDKTTREMEDAAEELLSMADIYNLPGLKTFCSQVLIKRISLDNVVDLLVLADMFPDKKLKVALFNFVWSNSKEVFALNSWPQIYNNFDLVTEILLNMPASAPEHMDEEFSTLHCFCEENSE
jgi:hypothetical protein